MRRRDVLAGIGSAGVVVGGGAIAAFGFPSIGDDPASGSTEGDTSENTGDEPIEIETVDAPGSEAGTVLVPAPDRPTFVDIFGTWCPPCVKQMPALAEANDRIGDEVLFVSVTSESIGENRSISEAELVDWWDDHGGNWTLGLDSRAELTARYWQGGYPSAVAIDASGTVRWGDSGIKSADELVTGIEQAIKADGDSEADT
ncbi:TlpA family protein disulfide reductase [Halosolutus gelatinilyticus]|uniref:TlpA family protein disulfide reductase n=1 Tax=Halosolutus gelatinilyticus TaxID=2931975 RepID=UPI001FF3628A|nr:TlpA disulfide reductase family protein [Halosolutus gelatinilyticus]